MMSKRLIPQLIIFSTLLLGLLGSVVTPVNADALANEKFRIRTVISLNNLKAIDLGEPFVLAGYIKDGYDRPVAEKSILFKVGDAYLGQARSDENGYFERKMNNKLVAGTYEITATSNATSTLAATYSSATLEILPAEIKIQTVPVVAGVTFQMDGKTFVSDEKGFASIQIDKVGQYRLHVLTDEYKNPSERIEFGRWLEESYQPFQDIKVPTDKEIQVGLNVYHLVSQSFVDLEGNPVDAGRITKFTIRSIQGDVFELTDGQPRWIPASRTARRASGLEESKLLYSVIDVMVDGSNVVNQSQQRFYSHPGDNWQISLLFYSMRLDARDGLFGNTVGKSVNLEFPDGSVKNYPLDKNGTVEIHSLPRGIYTIEFVGTNGMSNRSPVALSRDQEVHIKVITYLDMVVVGLLGVFVALGMLLYGRTKILHALLGKRKPVLEPSWASNQIAQESSLTQGFLVQDIIPQDIIRYEKALTLDAETFKHLTGVSQLDFENMLGFLHRVWGGRGRNAKLSQADQLLLSLIALKGEQNITQLSEAYKLSETTIRRIIKKVKATLANPVALHPLVKETLPIDRISIEKVVKKELDRLGNEISRIEWAVAEENVNNGINRVNKEIFIEGLAEDDSNSQFIGIPVESMNQLVEVVYEK